jgi:ketosteroid isomerase-like protein
MGVGNTPDFATASFAFNNKPVSFSPGTMAELQTAEQTLIASTTDSANRSKAYALVVSRQAFLLNRNHRLPVTNRSQINELMQSMPSVIQYQQHGAGLAKSGDLGYVYGTTTINGKTDNYLRIWRREGKEWKLVLEVLPYENLPAKAQ